MQVALQPRGRAQYVELVQAQQIADAARLLPKTRESRMDGIFVARYLDCRNRFSRQACRLSNKGRATCWCF